MLSDILTAVDLRGDELPLVAVDQTTRFVHVATRHGAERVDSAYRKVHVPMHDWQAMGIDPDIEIVRVLVEASSASPLKMPSPSQLDDLFWVRQRGWKAMLFNEALLGKFVIPEDILVMTTADPDLIPLDKLILVAPGAGFLVRQAELRGVVSNRSAAMLQIQFFTV